MLDNHAAFTNCTSLGRAPDSMMDLTKLFILVGWDGQFFCSVHWGSTGVFLLLQIFTDAVRPLVFRYEV